MENFSEKLKAPEGYVWRWEGGRSISEWHAPSHEWQLCKTVDTDNRIGVSIGNLRIGFGSDGEPQYVITFKLNVTDDTNTLQLHNKNIEDLMNLFLNYMGSK